MVSHFIGYISHHFTIITFQKFAAALDALQGRNSLSFHLFGLRSRSKPIYFDICGLFLVHKIIHSLVVLGSDHQEENVSIHWSNRHVGSNESNFFDGEKTIFHHIFLKIRDFDRKQTACGGSEYTETETQLSNLFNSTTYKIYISIESTDSNSKIFQNLPKFFIDYEYSKTQENRPKFRIGRKERWFVEIR